LLKGTSRRHFTSDLLYFLSSIVIFPPVLKGILEIFLVDFPQNFTENEILSTNCARVVAD